MCAEPKQSIERGREPTRCCRAEKTVGHKPDVLQAVARASGSGSTATPPTEDGLHSRRVYLDVVPTFVMVAILEFTVDAEEFLLGGTVGGGLLLAV